MQPYKMSCDALEVPRSKAKKLQVGGVKLEGQYVHLYFLNLKSVIQSKSQNRVIFHICLSEFLVAFLDGFQQLVASKPPLKQIKIYGRFPLNISQVQSNQYLIFQYFLVTRLSRNPIEESSLLYLTFLTI